MFVRYDNVSRTYVQSGYNLLPTSASGGKAIVEFKRLSGPTAGENMKRNPCGCGSGRSQVEVAQPPAHLELG